MHIIFGEVLYLDTEVFAGTHALLGESESLSPEEVN